MCVCVCICISCFELISEHSSCIHSMEAKSWGKNINLGLNRPLKLEFIYCFSVYIHLYMYIIHNMYVFRLLETCPSYESTQSTTPPQMTSAPPWWACSSGSRSTTFEKARYVSILGSRQGKNLTQGLYRVSILQQGLGKIRIWPRVSLDRVFILQQGPGKVSICPKGLGR